MTEFTFEPSAVELALMPLPYGGSITALELLRITGQQEQLLEEAFQILEEKQIALDISGLFPQLPGGSTALRLKQEKSFTDVNQLLQLEENDPLRLYVQELSQIAAAGDIHVLALQLLEGQDVAEQIVNLSLSRVVQLALEHTGRGLLLMDLIQEGSLGLWQSVLCYAGGDIQAHCSWWIRQYMARAILLNGCAGDMLERLRQGMEDYRDVDQQLLTELGRNPTLEEIAQKLHIPAQEAASYAAMVEQARSMDRVRRTEAPEEPREEDQQAVEDTAYFAQRQRILELLSVLEEADAQLLRLRFGLDGGLPLSPEQTGARLGLTAQQVVEKEAAALQKLRREG